ncbi:ABC transporter ATP-binding protein [Georgenia muralis]|uniref:Energy-coupling factor transport system ATP-binding protein n=1 Tax=Georgenia muralis TaxID=154117 RepID=A0A3N4Z4R2_9MICO|nr:ABC transporter ATP-binding protein [Georgenia muralis]RPF26706.1 energy-coupling factor transport system ATP-binding protein [Georgenia muralis]
MIRFEDVTVTYAGAAGAALRGVSAHVEEGELCLVVGPTGSGKSTLLGAASGRVPHLTGGLLAGHVVVEGRDTRDHRPRDLADVVGVVGQDPVAGFVTDTVEEELAFSLEQLGVTPGIMRKRVEEVLDLLSLAPLRSRPLADLSGGEQQRVAIGAVMTAQPRVLVLDEPTSALDPTAAEEVLAALARVVHDLGVTVLLAEHRLERVVQFADRVISLDVTGRAVTGPPAEVLARSAVAPPVVELGRVAGWDPLPMSVRDARRVARPLHDRLVELGGSSGAAGGPVTPPVAGPLLTARGVEVRHGAVHALRGVDLELRPGELVAVMGRNGSGKSSLLWALQGQGPRSGGSVRVGTPGADPAGLPPGQARRRIALVPQSPSDLLYLDTVGAECAAGDEQAGAEPGTVSATLDRLVPGVPADAHPRDLSEGQRLGLALAVQLAARPAVVLLDEPTRGLDYAAKDRLTRDLADLAAAGTAVLLSSHDVEFVAGFADRVLVLADGEVVADGPVGDVLRGSPTFAPQVSKILRPLDVLTVDDVRELLAVGRAT